MWLNNETTSVTMIDLLKSMKEELEKAAYKLPGQNVKSEAGSQSSEEALSSSRDSRR